MSQANWSEKVPDISTMDNANVNRHRKEPNGTDLYSLQQPSDSNLVDTAPASGNPTIPANKDGKRYSMRQIFQVWYDNERTVLSELYSPAKNSESYKLSKPTPIYHLELQHAVRESELDTDALDKSVKMLSVDDDHKAAANPPPNLPAPVAQTYPLVDSSVKLVQPSNIHWLYLDPSGNEQGPFSGDVMQEWLTEGYLNFDLRIRRSQESQFRTLSEFCEKLQNFTHPFKVPLPDLDQNLHSSSAGAPNAVSSSLHGNLDHSTVPAPLHANGTSNTLSGTPTYQPGVNPNGNLSTFSAPLYSQLLPNGGLGAANMRMPSSNSLFDFMGNNDYSLMKQQQFPSTNQFGIDPTIKQNIGAGFGQLHMLSLLHQQIQPTQPLLSRSSSTWGIEPNITGNSPAVNPNPLGMSQPIPMSPWLSGVQSISRVNSPFVSSSTLTSEPAVKADDHILHDLHSSMVTGILNDDDHPKGGLISGPAIPDTISQPKPQEQPPVVKLTKKPAKPVEAEAQPVEMQQEQIPASTEDVQIEAEKAPEPIKSEMLEKVRTEEHTQPALAPWAGSSSSNTYTQPKLTLKEIQQLEAERLQKERQMRAELKQEQAQSLANSLTAQKNEEKTSEKVTFNWANVSQPVAQKTFAEIQKEEAEARAKVAKVSSVTGAPISKPSLASSLANAVPKEDFSAWTTVASKKTVPKKLNTQPSISSPTNASLSPQMLRAASSNNVIGSSVNNNALKEDFMVWVRSAMTNLYPSVSKDDLLEIFTTLPAVSESAQLISETIYSSSATMDGRRFAEEFMKRRQQVERQLGPGDNGSWSAAISVSADKLPTVDDDGWSTSVKSKKKGKKN